MTDMTLVDQLVSLFKEAGEAHHQAFISVGGEDPNWADWYAKLIYPRLLPLLETDLSEAQVAKLLKEMEDRREADSPDADWPRFYADILVDRFGP